MLRGLPLSGSMHIHTPHKSMFTLNIITGHMLLRSMPNIRTPSIAMYELLNGTTGAATSAGEPPSSVMYVTIYTQPPMHGSVGECVHRMT